MRCAPLLLACCAAAAVSKQDAVEVLRFMYRARDAPEGDFLEMAAPYYEIIQSLGGDSCGGLPVCEAALKLEIDELHALRDAFDDDAWYDEDGEYHPHCKTPGEVAPCVCEEGYGGSACDTPLEVL